MTEFIKLELAISRQGLKINGKEYKANIQFDNNEIIVCDETKENADWLNDLFDNAQDLKKYIVVYQAKKYELLPESLLTLIIFKLKNQLSGIINEIEINIPEDSDQEIIQRIKSSLLVINIPNSFTEIDEETYLNKPRSEHYSKEDFSISKIIDGEEEYLRFKREYDSAMVHYNKLKTLISDNTQLYHKTLAEEAFVYYRKNDYQSAISNLLEAYESDADHIKIMAVKGLADCYKMIGDTVRSTEYLMYIAEYMNQLTVTKKYNMNAISLLNAYIESKSVHSKDAGMAWILVVVTVVIAVIITIYYILRKKHNMIIKDKNLETLMIKVDAIYRDKYGNKKQRILDEFNAVFPETIAVLKETYSDLNETEVNVCVLSFFPFQLKEVADILNLRVNTVSKSKISLKKKTNKENINDILRPFIS